MESEVCDRDLSDTTMDDSGWLGVAEESLTSSEPASRPGSEPDSEPDLEPEPEREPEWEPGPTPEPEREPYSGREPELLNVTTRAYQLEMFNESMNGNTIVTMDTGSGKTHVALLRIMAELERSDKLILFLVPTITLANQQFRVIQTQIPAGHARCISGHDNVDTWSAAVWEAFLLNTRVVVSTYQLILDAMKHGFVKLDQISLMVIDEVHNCVSNNPVARLMKDLYWPAKHEQRSVPHILGLTASPVMKSKSVARIQQEFALLEQVLDAQCKTPHRHRAEFLARVNRPEMIVINYGSPDLSRPSHDTNSCPVEGVDKLEKARTIMIAGIENDPDIRQLVARVKRSHKEAAKRRLYTAITSSNTRSLRHIKDLCTRTRRVESHLGPWAADYYIYRIMSQLEARTQGDAKLSARDEVRYLYQMLTSVGLRPDPPAPIPDVISPKVEALLDLLSSQGGDHSGIVFVLERVTAVVIAHLLSVHPKTRDRFRVGSVVGSSYSALAENGRADLASSAQKSRDVTTLADFRTGKTNLVVATSVLEEGIDVPACNLVVCFDPPPNVKGFIQRRGRARASRSRLFLFAKTGDQDDVVGWWMELEAEMKRQFEQDMRETEQLSRLECEEAREHDDYPVLVGKGTGARLTIADARRHLEYFCAKMLNRQFTDWHPVYIIHELPGPDPADDSSEPAILLKATVHLPACLAPELRKTDGIRVWKSEAMACKDAAFQAYAVLYRAGMVNEHLVPAVPERETLEGRAGLVMVRERFNPWVWVAQAWQDSRTVFKRTFTLTSGSDDGDHHVRFQLTLPMLLPRTEDDVALYWHPNSKSPWHLRVVEDTSGDNNANRMDYDEDDDAYSSGHGRTDNDDDDDDDMAVLMDLTYGYRWSGRGESQYPMRLAVDGFTLRASDIATREFSKEDMEANRSVPYLVRDTTCNNRPYFYIDWTPSKPPGIMYGHWSKLPLDIPEDGPHAILKQWPKKTGFLRALRPQSRSQSSQPLGRKDEQASSSAGQQQPTAATGSRRALRAIPTQLLKVDKVPATYAYLGSLVPIITHVFELRLVAQDLLVNRLSEVGIQNLELVATALCSRRSGEPTNYERLEFLGDSLLKLLTSINCAAEWLDFPEGYLSYKKDAVVNNARLSRAAREFGLDQYIFNEPFTLPRWREIFVSPATAAADPEVPKPDEMSDAPPPPPPPETQGLREMSTKTLADVVEALIGACYTDGGLSRAQACIRLFLPEVRPWFREVEVARKRMFDMAPACTPLPILLQPVESLLGHSFRRKALLVEAMTHPSFAACSGRTLDRMEFIGDSILDYIVVTKLINVGTEFKPEQLHLLREALVNADILAYFVMDMAVEQEYAEVVPDTASTSDSDGVSRPSPPPPPSSSRSPSPDPAGPPSRKRARIGVHTELARLSLPLWTFMRHDSTDMAAQQQAGQARHAKLRSRIRDALASGAVYPWALLARLGAGKFFSDLLEAVLGAVWVDSGDRAACERVLEAAGVLALLRRLAAGGVHLRHPVEELNIRVAHRTIEFKIEERPRVTKTEEGGGGEMDADTAMVGHGSDGSGGTGHFIVVEEGDIDDDEEEEKEKAEEEEEEDEVVVVEEEKREFTCKIFIDERCVIEARGGAGREEVKTFAAEELVRIWDTLDLGV